MATREDIYEDIIKDIPNQEFLNSLAPFSQVGLHNEPAAEIWKIMKTFEATSEKNGPDTFTQMLVLLDSDYEPMVVLEPRPYTSHDDMYSAFVEMLFSYSSYQASAMIFVSDVKMTNVQTQEKRDALSVNFINSSAAGVVNMPYTAEDNKVIWHIDEFASFGMEDAPADKYSLSGVLSEMFYIMSHINQSIFPMNTLINYYNFRDFPMLLNDENIVQKIKIDLS